MCKECRGEAFHVERVRQDKSAWRQRSGGNCRAHLVSQAAVQTEGEIATGSKEAAAETNLQQKRQSIFSSSGKEDPTHHHQGNTTVNLTKWSSYDRAWSSGPDKQEILTLILTSHNTFVTCSLPYRQRERPGSAVDGEESA
jgi:hypothetical protein